MTEESDDQQTERVQRAIMARQERRDRIRLAGFDPDAYPKEEFDCDHAYTGPTNRCVACGHQR